MKNGADAHFEAGKVVAAKLSLRLRKARNGKDRRRIIEKTLDESTPPNQLTCDQVMRLFGVTDDTRDGWVPVQWPDVALLETTLRDDFRALVDRRDAGPLKCTWREVRKLPFLRRSAEAQRVPHLIRELTGHLRSEDMKAAIFSVYALALAMGRVLDYAATESERAEARSQTLLKKHGAKIGLKERKKRVRQKKVVARPRWLELQRRNPGTPKYKLDEMLAADVLPDYRDGPQRIKKWREKEKWEKA